MSVTEYDAAVQELHRLGQSLQSRGEYRSAITQYEKCVRLPPPDGSPPPTEIAAHARYSMALCKLLLRNRGTPLNNKQFVKDEMVDFIHAFSMYGQQRLEPLFWIVRFFRLAKQFEKACMAGMYGKDLISSGVPSGDFVEKDVY